MEMKKLAPWNWFQNEQEGRTGFATSFPTLRSGLRDPLTTMRTDMDRLLDSFGRGFEPTSFESFRPFAPAVDVRDEGKDYIVSVEIPGVDKKDIKLEISNGLLFIQGEKKHEHKEEKQNFYRRESAYGYFERTLNLPMDADEERVSADFKNGVLKIDIAKQEGARRASGREIAIQ